MRIKLFLKTTPMIKAVRKAVEFQPYEIEPRAKGKKGRSTVVLPWATRSGDLLIVGHAEPNGCHRRYRCVCICGTETVSYAQSLKRDSTRCCGCRRRGARPNPAHVGADKRLINLWRGLHWRCARDADYVRKGITVCEEWSGATGFRAFEAWSRANGYAADLTIDRIDSKGHYEPSNCRWTDRDTQSRNRSWGLTEEQVIEVRRRYAGGEPQASIFRKMGLTRGAVGHVCTYHTWQNIAPELRDACLARKKQP